MERNIATDEMPLKLEVRNKEFCVTLTKFLILAFIEKGLIRLSFLRTDEPIYS